MKINTVLYLPDTLSPIFNIHYHSSDDSVIKTHAIAHYFQISFIQSDLVVSECFFNPVLEICNYFPLIHLKIMYHLIQII